MSVTRLTRKIALQAVESAAENRSRFIASTNQLARDGHIVEPAGIQTDNFLRSGTVLFDHDPRSPVARPVEATLNPQGQLEIEVEWAPDGVSEEADKVRGLVKAGILRAGSISFDPIDAEPLNPAKPRGGLHIKTSELMEFSIVSVPADTGAVVTQRSDDPEPNPAADPATEQSEETTTMAKTTQTRAIVAKHKRAIERAPKTPKFKRGLYQLAELAYILHQLGYAHEASEYEAAVEEDESDLPEMLGEALKTLGAAVVAMAHEEVEELINAAVGGEDDDEDLGDADRAFVAAGATPRSRAWRRATALIRAGKALSTTNAEKLESADTHHARALKHHKELGEHTEAAKGHNDAITAQQEKMQKAHGELGEALDAVKSNPAKATEHVARCMRAHKAIGTAMGAVSDTLQDAEDTHADAQDCHAAVGRHIKGAQRCVRAVLDGAAPTAEETDGDSKDVQTSKGTKESGGSENDRAFRQRQADLRRLEVAPA